MANGIGRRHTTGCALDHSAAPMAAAQCRTRRVTGCKPPHVSFFVFRTRGFSDTTVVYGPPTQELQQEVS